MPSNLGRSSAKRLGAAWRLFAVVCFMSISVGYYAFQPAATLYAASNLIANPSAEATNNGSAPTDWEANQYNWNTARFEYRAGGAQDGNRSLYIEVTFYQAGDAKWVFKPVNVTAGAVYRFNDWYKSSVVTSLVAAVTKSNGDVTYKGLKSLPASGDWTQSDVSFTAPSDAVKISVYHLISSVGYLQTDNYALSSGNQQPGATATPSPQPSVPTATPVAQPTATPVPQPTTPPTGGTGNFGRALVSLTFDDGLRSQFITGWPILQKYNFRGTFFLISSRLDGSTYVAPSEATALYRAGNEIGSHTVTHPFLTQLSASQVTDELANSKRTLENLIGAPVRNFALPYGNYNAAVQAQVKQYYRSMRTVAGAFNTKANFDPYRVLVCIINDQTSIGTIQYYVSEAKRTNAWLVLVYHGIKDNPVNDDTSPYVFDRQMATIRDSGIAVVTTDQALNEVGAP